MNPGELKMGNVDTKAEYLGRDLEAMSFAKNYHKWIIEEFKPYFGKNVAEVGAGSGNFSELLLKHVNNLIAFEPSKNMHSLLEKRFAKNPNIKIINSMFGTNCHKFEGCLDSVIYVNVLEHIKNDENELFQVYKSLIGGGHALIFVPALPFLYSDFDKNIGHFRRYLKNDFVKLAKKIGLSIKKAKYFDLAGIIPWYIFFVLFKKQLTRDRVLLYDKFAVPVMQKIEKLIIPPIGKNILLVMQKPNKITKNIS